MLRFFRRGGFRLGHSRGQINITVEEGNEKYFLTSPALQHDGNAKENAKDKKQGSKFSSGFAPNQYITLTML